MVAPDAFTNLKISSMLLFVRLSDQPRLTRYFLSSPASSSPNVKVYSRVFISSPFRTDKSMSTPRISVNSSTLIELLLSTNGSINLSFVPIILSEFVTYLMIVPIISSAIVLNVGVSNGPETAFHSPIWFSDDAERITSSAKVLVNVIVSAFSLVFVMVFLIIPSNLVEFRYETS